MMRYFRAGRNLLFILVILGTGCSHKSKEPTLTPAINSSKTITLHPSVDSTKNAAVNNNGRKTLKAGGLNGEYFEWKEGGDYFSGKPIATRVDSDVSFNGEFNLPSTLTTQDYFSIRWSGYLMVDKEEPYKIRVDADDGAQLTLDNKVVLPMASYSQSTTAYLTQGLHKLLLEYYQKKGVALCYLFWSEPPYRETAIIPSDHLYYEESSYQP